MHSQAQTIEMPQIQVPTYGAQELTNDKGQAHIVLSDQVYLLRITRAGKLILTK